MSVVGKHIAHEDGVLVRHHVVVFGVGQLVDIDVRRSGTGQTGGVLNRVGERIDAPKAGRWRVREGAVGGYIHGDSLRRRRCRERRQAERIPKEFAIVVEKRGIGRTVDDEHIALVHLVGIVHGQRRDVERAGHERGVEVEQILIDHAQRVATAGVAEHDRIFDRVASVRVAFAVDVVKQGRLVGGGQAWVRMRPLHEQGDQIKRRTRRHIRDRADGRGDQTSANEKK